MTHKECVKAILEKLNEIQEIYKSYNPDGEYLILTIDGKHMSFNNEYWEKDCKNKLFVHTFEDGEIRDEENFKRYLEEDEDDNV